MTHITSNRGSLKHDDIIDVVGMGVAYWVESMARDESDEFDKYEQNILDKELEEFNNEFGYETNSNNIMTNW
jgi:hypothetical protein